MLPPVNMCKRRTQENANEVQTRMKFLVNAHETRCKRVRNTLHACETQTLYTLELICTALHAHVRMHIKGAWLIMIARVLCMVHVHMCNHTLLRVRVPLHAHVCVSAACICVSATCVHLLLCTRAFVPSHAFTCHFSRV